MSSLIKLVYKWRHLYTTDKYRYVVFTDQKSQKSRSHNYAADSSFLLFCRLADQLITLNLIKYVAKLYYVNNIIWAIFLLSV